jgi:hypothetical protein
MPGCRRHLLAVVLALLLVGGTTGPADADEARHRRVLSFTDPAITESSGLVDGGSVLYTMNDSGHGPQIYTVDKHDGETVTTTTYTSDQVHDVEAIAPGRAGDVWVGDIGDNNANRHTVSIYRIPARSGRLPGRVEATRYDLAYPDGPRNAETLLVQPRTGRIYIVSKALFGGNVYRAPAHLHAGRINRLTAVAQVPGLVTDGAFLPDGRHVLLRTYISASVYTFPGFRPVGTVTLPRQPQGEGIAVGATGKIYISSEGAHSEVDRVFLPSSLLHKMTGPAVPTATPTGSAGPPGRQPASGRESIGVSEGGAWAVAVVGVLALAGLVFLTAFRRRSRRRR